MATPASTGSDADDADAGRAPRRYDSPVRRQRAAETRDRIVAAGSELVHELPSWDWREVTFRAVAERAGVGERTVYRHFPSERHLRDAVMQRLEEEAGVTYDDVTLGTLPDVAARVFASLHSFAVQQSAAGPDDPTFVAADERRRVALRSAVAEAAPHWSAAQQDTAAALLDVCWNLPSYERLVGAWGFEQEHATAAITWMIDRVVAAVEAGEAPPVPAPPRRRGRAARR
jgi:AcrR family transcriptional regulator